MGDKDIIPALERAISVINAIADGSGGVSVTDLSSSLRIPKTTCYRIVRTFLDADWVRQRPDGAGYELSFGLLSLFKPFETHRLLLDAIRPELTRLVADVGLSAKLSVRAGDDAITIHRVDSNQPFTLSGRTGARFHLAYGSSGAALLSALDTTVVERIIASAPPAVWARQTPEDVHQRIRDCRKRGWCADWGSYQPHIHTVSAVIHHQHRAWAALTLIGMPHELNASNCFQIARQLRACVERCERALPGTQELP